MLNRTLVISLLSVALLVPLAAQADGKDNAFCRGFIIKALAAFPIEGVSRVDLWLGWDAVVTRTGMDAGLSGPEYDAGREAFETHFNAGDMAALVDIRDGRCDMGRNSGWVWW
jgi:hypothetical protein